MTLSILYRGPLESCNYGCTYCPFAKKKEDRAALERDRASLRRFVDWVDSERGRRVSVFFTPWGEALVRHWYREAIAELSRLPNVARVAIQTNLSAPLAFLDRTDSSKVGLWCTYHPEWTTLDRFVGRVEWLRRRQLRHSVGVVGFRRFFPEIERLRAALPSSTYLWVNAVKSHEGGERYTEDDVAFLSNIDPLFGANRFAHSSKDRACKTGDTVVSVDGEGIVRRCHFVREPIANLYEPGALDRALAPRPCPNDRCGCHIGYVHLDELELYSFFGEGVLERAPSEGLVHLRARASARSSNWWGPTPSLTTPLR
ncbi:MAG: radical SAM protein [Polyangiaceae bacterium]|nr:radical SAM protein [Polyangiaceae bacterium]